MSQPAPLPWPAEVEPPESPATPVGDAAKLRGDKRRKALEARRRSFLRMVSHELRTPLNTVIGFSEIIACELYGPLGAPQYKEYAELVRQSGHRLLKLVNQVIEIARLEDGVVDLDPRPEALDHAIDDALATLKDEIAAKALRIVVAERAFLPAVVADSRGLRTVLQNLLHNAVTHSPAGGLISIGAVRSARGVELVIADRGPGVEPAALPRLLRPFEQGGEALTRLNEGAGLGLPISALLMRAMHGQLRLRSRPGEGFTAIVTLPPA
jgi:signal transduction histidine kinase